MAMLPHIDLRVLLLAAVGWLPATGALPADPSEELRQAFEAPGTVAIMRHAIAPGTGDPSGFDIGDCSTQRNLDDRGRKQARKVGQAFRAAGIAVDRVLTSQWCRCRETARLLELGSKPNQHIEV